MKKIHISPKKNCKAVIKVEGDKSISHRAIIIGSIAKGKTEIENFLEAEDTLNTVNIFREMGVKIEKKGDNYFVYGNGLNSLREPNKILYSGNSGTGIRLTLGILAAQPFTSTITGDSQVVKRPMMRVIEPLTRMGAKFQSNNGYAPITVYGSNLKGITYKMPIASAQVKSSIMLAALYADGITEIIEPVKSRDHTERMLKYFGAKIFIKNNKIKIMPHSELIGKRIFVPCDISSAAFFIVAGLLMKGSKIKLKNVCINPTRTGIIDALKKMGGKIKIVNKRIKNNEPIGDIIASTSKLKGTTIKGSLIPRLIDEIPVISIAAAFAKGKTVIKDAKELRVKETDRIKTITKNLKRIGIKVIEKEDGMIIYGNNMTPFKYADIDSFGDHRIAMAFSIAALVGDNGLLIKDIDCVNTSFPNFFRILNNL